MREAIEDDDRSADMVQRILAPFRGTTDEFLRRELGQDAWDALWGPYLEKIGGAIDALRAQAREEGRAEDRAKIDRVSEPWSLVEIVRRLVEAGDGHEGVLDAVQAGRSWLDRHDRRAHDLRARSLDSVDHAVVASSDTRPSDVNQDGERASGAFTGGGVDGSDPVAEEREACVRAIQDALDSDDAWPIGVQAGFRKARRLAVAAIRARGTMGEQ